MTEVQVIALQQMSMALSAFHQQHLLIKAKTVKLDTDDHYDPAQVEIAIKVTDSQLRQLCLQAGKSNLTGTGLETPPHV